MKQRANIKEMQRRLGLLKIVMPLGFVVGRRCPHCHGNLFHDTDEGAHLCTLCARTEACLCTQR